jgi:hypothetical protein
MGILRAFSCLLLILISGCGPKGPSLAELNNTNILRARAAYGVYLISHGLKGPKSKEELMDYLKNSETARVKLKKIDVSQDSIDEIFISERDGEPFKIRYGLRGMSDHAVIFESVGVDGKRMVAYNTPVELDDAAYEKAWKGKTKAVNGLDEMLSEE